MCMLVLGAGLQGSACAYDLLQHPRVERVTVADLKPDSIPAFINPYVGKRLALLTLDVQDAAAVRAAVRGHDAVLNAAPYYFNLDVSRAAVDVGAHCADLGAISSRCGWRCGGGTGSRPHGSCSTTTTRPMASAR
ncbi:MAG: saccharopine dehydrogenase NADP-binding domain-containing protein [Gemmatimonadales bacterium]